MTDPRLLLLLALVAALALGWLWGRIDRHKAIDTARAQGWAACRRTDADVVAVDCDLSECDTYRFPRVWAQQIPGQRVALEAVRAA